MCSYTNIDVKQVVCHWVLYSIINVNVMNTSDTKTHIQQDHTGIVLNILGLAIYSLAISHTVMYKMSLFRTSCKILLIQKEKYVCYVWEKYMYW